MYGAESEAAGPIFDDAPSSTLDVNEYSQDVNKVANRDVSSLNANGFKVFGIDALSKLRFTMQHNGNNRRRILSGVVRSN